MKLKMDYQDIAELLNSRGKLPKRGREYTKAIVNQVVIGRTKDNNVNNIIDEINNLSQQLSKTTPHNA